MTLSPIDVGRLIAGLTLGTVLAVCGTSEPVAPRAVLTPAEQLEVVATPQLADTIGSRPLEGLVVRVRNPDGSPRCNAVVRFMALPSSAPARPGEAGAAVASVTGSLFGALAIDSTNDAGEARALIRFGTVSGTTRVVALVPEIGVADTISVNVLPGLPVGFALTARDTNVVPGATYNVGASLRDRAGNAVSNEPITFTATTSNLRADANGSIAALAPGAGIVVVRGHGLVDTARVTVLPVAGRIVGYALPNIVLVNIDGTNLERIGTTYQTSTFPHAAPGGRLIAFYEGNPTSGSATISLVTAGSAPHSIVGFAGAAWPRWSDNGEWMYYTATEGDRRVVARIRADGTGQHTIAAYGGAEYPAPGVSPDGATVAVEDGGLVSFIDVATGAIQKTAVTCSMPQFSPDAARIACMFGSRIKVFTRDGTGERFIGPAVYNQLSGVEWSPDGAYLLAVRGSSIPGNGTPVPTLVNVATEAVIPLRLPLSITQAAFVR